LLNDKGIDTIELSGGLHINGKMGTIRTGIKTVAGDQGILRKPGMSPTTGVSIHRRGWKCSWRELNEVKGEILREHSKKSGKCGILFP